jgi:hypothetical protein
MRTILSLGFAFVMSGASGAFAQTLPLPPVPIPLSVSGKEARGTFLLPGNIGAELTITFERVVGLHPKALEASVALVNPLDPDLLRRLLGGLRQVSVPVTFPVLLRIAPSPSSSLSFAGVVTVSLYTHNLRLTSLLPLALHKAPDEEAPFQDITSYEGMGSYRAGGSSDGFSEFLIVIDRRSIDTVIRGKFDALEDSLSEHEDSMPDTVVRTLEAILEQAETLYRSGNLPAAIGQLSVFSSYVKDHSGEEIPDVWRANCAPGTNVAGALRAGADTLKFSLSRRANQ